MRKFLLILLSLFLLTGCGKKDDTDVIKEFKNNIEKSKSYRLIGTMELNSDEESFNYNIDVSYLKDEYYKVEMTNTKNNHKQIILKNDDGLYVITPSLNKSFKFESAWPDNSSQGYILSSLIKDIENDEDRKIVEGNIIKTNVDYPNNSDLKYQKIYLDKSYTVKKVEVYSDSDIAKIVINFSDVDLKAGLNKDTFKLENYITESKDENKETDENTNETTDTNETNENKKDENVLSSIESAIYPLYMPSNTYLSGSDVVTSDTESRVILTFSGEKNFVIVEEKASYNDEHEIIPIYGEPLMLNDTIAALSSSSIYWTSNDVDYYLASDDLSVTEMVFVASSLGNYSSAMAVK